METLCNVFLKKATTILIYYKHHIQMKIAIIPILLLLITIHSNAQENNVNLNRKGFAAEGYDVTEYFNNKAIEGSKKITAVYNGATYAFVNNENKKKFESDPSKFEPQYGGYCAYAIGAKAKKVGINPKSFLIENGKLYLFYDNAFIDTKQKWLKEDPEKLRQQGDANWKKIKTTN